MRNSHAVCIHDQNIILGRKSFHVTGALIIKSISEVFQWEFLGCWTTRISLSYCCLMVCVCGLFININGLRSYLLSNSNFHCSLLRVRNVYRYGRSVDYWVYKQTSCILEKIHICITCHDCSIALFIWLNLKPLFLGVWSMLDCKRRKFDIPINIMKWASKHFIRIGVISRMLVFT